MGLGSIGLTELIIIFAIIFLFIGGKKIPELARGLGESIREFKKAKREDQKELDKSNHDDNDRIDWLEIIVRKVILSYNK